MATRSAKIDQKADLIWAIADKLTGVYKPHEYGDVILPLTVIRRFDCILSDTKDAVLQKYDEVKNLPMKDILLRICDFLDYLVTNVHNTSNNAGKKRNLIRGLCADIKDVSFSLDSKIFGEDFEVLPLGIGKNAYRMQEDILFCKERGNANSTFNELVVMSPFLSESVIADFNLTDRALSDCKRTLVTRRSELGKLKASDVDNFTIYALKDEIIDGEEEISDELADKKKQDIHAKIYLRRKYSDVDL